MLQNRRDRNCRRFRPQNSTAERDDLKIVCLCRFDFRIFPTAFRTDNGCDIFQFRKFAKTSRRRVRQIKFLSLLPFR